MFHDATGGFRRIWRKGRCIIQCLGCTARKSSRTRTLMDWMLKHERCTKGGEAR